jgi:serine/threonine protein kinase
MQTTVTQTCVASIGAPIGDGVPSPIEGDVSMPIPPIRVRRPAVDEMPVAGSRVGRYVIEQRIGEGGMGVVYRAFDPEVGRSIALKFARAKQGTIDAKVWSRLRREAQALGRIRHPGVVSLYEMGHDTQGAFLALELVHGLHLRRWLHQKPRSVEQIVGVIERAALALAAVHRAGLLHRDIKPTNILVDANDRVVLVDFGLALGFAELDSTSSHNASMETNTCRTRMTRTNMVVGTTNYMSPEQLLGRDLDVRSDLFSLAVTAYEALCGERPYPATTPYALAVSFDARERPVVPRGVIDRTIERALLDALEIDPAARTSTAEDFAAALRPRRPPMLGLIAAVAAGALLGAGVTGSLVWPRAAQQNQPETTESAAAPAIP